MVVMSPVLTQLAAGIADHHLLQYPYCHGVCGNGDRMLVLHAVAGRDGHTERKRGLNTTAVISNLHGWLFKLH